MKRALKFAIPVAAIIAQGIDEPADADVFLKIEGIDGESTTEGHEGEIDVLAWSWGVSNSFDIGSIGGGGGTGKSSFTPIKIIKSVDSATNELLLKAAVVDSIPEAFLTVTRQTAKGADEEYLKLRLIDVYVTKVAHGGKDTEVGVAETLLLEWIKVEAEYRRYDASKGTFGPWEPFNWDRAANTSS